MRRVHPRMKLASLFVLSLVLGAIQTYPPSLQPASAQSTAQSGREILTNGDFRQGTHGWALSVRGNARAQWQVIEGIGPKESMPSLQVSVEQTGVENWHVMVEQRGLKAPEGKWYRLSFWARAAQTSARITWNLQQASEPYRRLSPQTAVITLSDRWEQYTLAALATADPNVKLNFIIGYAATTFWFAAVSLQELECLSADEIHTLLNERGGEVWRYAAEDRLNIKTSSDCAVLDGNSLRYKDALTGREIKLSRIGTKMYGHWSRIKGSGSATWNWDPPQDVLWVDIYQSATEKLALVKYTPPRAHRGSILTYRIVLWVHPPDDPGKNWKEKASVSYCHPDPRRQQGGGIDGAGACFWFTAALIPLNEARAFSQKFVPALMDFIEDGFFDRLGAGAK